MTLPTTPQTRQSINVKPQQARTLLVGTPKSGKTTLLANWAPATTLIIDTQHGTDLLDGEHYVAHVGDWPSFCAVVKDLTTTRHSFLTVGIDLIDDVWKFADAHFHGKGAPLASATNDFQKSLNTAEGMFRIEVGKLLASPLGVWFLSHADEKGDPVRYVSKLDKKVLSWVQGATQFVFLAEALGTGGRRQLHTQPSASFEAGSRVPMPEPMALDARELWLEMDRGLNPHLYTPEAVAARKAKADDSTDAPANEPPTPVVADQPPAEPAPQPRAMTADTPKATPRAATAKQRGLINAQAADAKLDHHELANALLTGSGHEPRKFDNADQAKNFCDRNLDRLPAAMVDAVLEAIKATAKATA